MQHLNKFRGTMRPARVANVRSGSMDEADSSADNTSLVMNVPE